MVIQALADESTMNGEKHSEEKLENSRTVKSGI
jgi:hypothetical protein